MTNIDKTDSEIITLLQKNGRLSNIAIAERIGVSEATVRRRVTRLENEDLIRIVAIANPLILEPSVMAIIGLQVEINRIREIEKSLVAQPEIRFVGATLGEYDLICEVWFRSNEELMAFLSDTIGHIEGIQRSETFQIMRVKKYSYDWVGKSSQRLTFVQT